MQTRWARDVFFATFFRLAASLRVHIRFRVIFKWDRRAGARNTKQPFDAISGRQIGRLWQSSPSSHF